MASFVSHCIGNGDPTLDLGFDDLFRPPCRSCLFHSFLSLPSRVSNCAIYSAKVLVCLCRRSDEEERRRYRLDGERENNILYAARIPRRDPYNREEEEKKREEGRKTDDNFAINVFERSSFLCRATERTTSRMRRTRSGVRIVPKRRERL